MSEGDDEGRRADVPPPARHAGEPEPTADRPDWQPQYGPGGPPFGGYQQAQPPWSRGPGPDPAYRAGYELPDPPQGQAPDWRAASQEMAADPSPGPPRPAPGGPPPRARRARSTAGAYRVPEDPAVGAPPPSAAPPSQQHGAPPVDPAAPPGIDTGPTAQHFPPPHPVAQHAEPYPAPAPPPAPPPAPADAPRVGPYDQQPYDLSSAQLLRPAKRAPQSGWRRAVYTVSGGLVNLGQSKADLARRELVARVNHPLHGCYKIAMLSLKGGVGKTTTTTTLGATFASLRGDRVVALDANPDRGTLAFKQPLETNATVRHLLLDAERIRRYSDVRAYTSQGASRLEIIASEQDPAVSEAFSDDDYRRAVEVLEHFYNIVLTDCGTGLMHSAMRGVLDLTDCLVIVSSASIDAARSASATLDWLDAHGYRELVARSIAVINSVRPKAGSVDVDRLAAHFESRCRTVCRIPFDSHLEEGAEIDMERLAGRTRDALLELAATVADDFPHAVAPTRR